MVCTTHRNPTWLVEASTGWGVPRGGPVAAAVVGRAADGREELPTVEHVDHRPGPEVSVAPDEPGVFGGDLHSRVGAGRQGSCPQRRCSDRWQRGIHAYSLISDITKSIWRRRRSAPDPWRNAARTCWRR